MPNQEFEALIDRLRALLSAEYHRGEQDAIARIMKAVAPDAEAPAAVPVNGAAHLQSKPKRRRKEPVRKGTAKALIDRVLREHGPRGASPNEIKAAAVTGAERHISHSGLRFALTTGRDDNRYTNRDGKWFMTTPSPSVVS
jgi:hypothetical protein